MVQRAVNRSDHNRRSFVGAAGAGFLSLSARQGWAADWLVGHREPEPGVHMVLDTSASPLTLKAIKPPEFKRWPPHSPSARHITGDGMSKYEGAPESDLLAQIEDNLLDLGYPKVFYFALPNGGSALAAPFERINDDATPLHEDRFNLEPTFRSVWLGRKPIPRHLRAIVFFLGSTRIPSGQPPTSFSKHRKALEAGVNQLGDGLQFAPISQQHRLTTFIYEYFARHGEEPRFLGLSAVSGIDHLRRSKIVN